MGRINYEYKCIGTDFVKIMFVLKFGNEVSEIMLLTRNT